MERIEAEAFTGGVFQYVIVPDSCVSIDDKAFADCKNLSYIRIPASVKHVATDAFSGCGRNLIIDRLN